jgi:hypothetical protein
MKTTPKVSKDNLFGTMRSHPSFAKVNVSRVSGRADLFQSAFTHQHHIALRISRCEQVGDDYKMLSEKEQLIEVAMSESQFARMITSLNMGSGSACTLQYFNGTRVEQPTYTDQRETHRHMVGEELKSVMDKQQAFCDQIDTWQKEKHRPTLTELRELLCNLKSFTGNFRGNMEYFAGVFEKHMETVVNEAKTEIEAHMAHTAGVLGLSEQKQLGSSDE